MYWICKDCGTENEYTDVASAAPCTCCGVLPCIEPEPPKNIYQEAMLLLKVADSGTRDEKKQAIRDAVDLLMRHGMSPKTAYSKVSTLVETLDWGPIDIRLPNWWQFLLRPRNLKILIASIAVLCVILFVRELLLPPDLTEIDRSQYWNTVAVDYGRTVAIKNDGSLICAGPGLDADIDDAVDVALGTSGFDIAVLREDGTVYFEGDSFYDYEAPKWTDAVDVDLGEYYAIAAKEDGTVVAEFIGYTEEYRDYGQCEVSSWDNIISVAAGDSHSVGLRADGKVVAVGNNRDGQCDVSEWKGIIAIGAGRDYTIGLKRNGEVLFAGRDDYSGLSQLETWDNIVAVSADSDSVTGLKKDGSVITLSLYKDTSEKIVGWSDIAGIAAGGDQIVGIRGDGSLLGVGDNYLGSLNFDNGDWQYGVVGVLAGDSYTMGLRRDGTAILTDRQDVSEWSDIYCIASGSESNLVVGLSSTGQIYSTDPDLDFTEWSDVALVEVSDSHVVGLRSDGTVVAVGDNEWGQCNVEKIRSAATIFTGPEQTGAIRKDGTVVVVGNNEYGQCNTQKWRNIVSVAINNSETVGLKSNGTMVTTAGNDTEITKWTEIVSFDLGLYHIVGLREDGTVVACGYNEYGQCDVSEWTDIIAVEAGAYHTVGLKSDGTVVAVGDNSYGQCDVQDWHNITAISVSDYWGNHTVGLDSYGGVEATGANYWGQCNIYLWPPIRLPSQR